MEEKMLELLQESREKLSNGEIITTFNDTEIWDY